MRSFKAFGFCFVLTLCALWPHSTWAEVISDAARRGEWAENGEKFGDIVIQGKLVKDASGWVLLRTMENQSDEPRTCRLEERVMRTETMFGARVNPPPLAVVLRGLTVSLKAHEKRSIGVRLSAAVSDAIDKTERERDALEGRRTHAILEDRYEDNVFHQTFFVYEVEYLRPLAPGETAWQPDAWEIAQRPAAMPMMAPPPPLQADL